MRHPPTRSWRAIIALILLQVSLAGPWASHVGAAAAGPAAVHVEAAGDARCPVVHDEDRCLACQASGQRIAVTAAVAVPSLEAVRGRASRQGADSSYPRTIAPPNQPRAPPTRIA